MSMEFIKNSQKFGIKKSMEPICLNEATVKFVNPNEMQGFFNNAMKDRVNAISIQRIADGIAPSYIRRSLKSPPPLTESERLDFLFSEISKGNARVVLKNNSLKPEEKRKIRNEAIEDNFFESINFSEFIEKQVEHLRRIYSRIADADYSIVETVFKYDENSNSHWVPCVIDPSSIKEHSTGWKSWDNPFEIAALGAFKTVVTYHSTNFLNMSNSIKFAAAVGANTELVSAHYNVTGKSVIAKKWYGSFAIGFNLKTLSWELPWLKFSGCGPEERRMVELKRKDRLVFHDRPIYNHKEQIIPPFVSMEEFLSEYHRGFHLPEHNITKPIKIGNIASVFK